ncbi:Collagen alpha-4(IV) chain, partial [Ophiophagus hannah]
MPFLPGVKEPAASLAPAHQNGEVGGGFRTGRGAIFLSPFGVPGLPVPGLASMSLHKDHTDGQPACRPSGIERRKGCVEEKGREGKCIPGLPPPSAGLSRRVTRLPCEAGKLACVRVRILAIWTVRHGRIKAIILMKFLWNMLSLAFPSALQ